jgi:hypothetical protein
MDNKLRLTQRELKEIHFCLIYRREEFRHGTDGHNARMIIAKFADRHGFWINGETGKLETPPDVEVLPD